MNHTEYLEAKKHFKPHSKAAKVRQHIWAIIGAEPSKKFTVSLVRHRLNQLGIDLKDGEIYSAMKKLCISGLARRVVEELVAPTKKDPARKKGITAIQSVSVWTESAPKQW